MGGGVLDQNLVQDLLHWPRTHFLIKVMELVSEWVHMVPYGFILKQDTIVEVGCKLQGVRQRCIAMVDLIV